MFGIRIVTKRGLEKIRQDAKSEAFAEAVVELVALLQRKDRIYLEPVTLVGNSQIVQDCAFLGIKGTALTVKTLSVALAEAAARKRLSDEDRE